MLENLVRSTMLLFFNGCSNTYGGELENISGRYSKIVSDHYGVQEENDAACGISNDRITCSTIKKIQRNEIDHVIIQFTVPSRIRYYDDRGRENSWTPSDRNKKKHNNFARDQWYKHVYNRHMGVENMWKNMYLFDIFCKSVGQKYTALIADHWTDDLDIDAHWKKDLSPIRIHRDILRYDSLLLEHKHPSNIGHRKIAKEIIKHVDS